MMRQYLQYYFTFIFKLTTAIQIIKVKTKKKKKSQ